MKAKFAVIGICLIGWLAPSAEMGHPTGDLLKELLRIDTSNPPGNEGSLDQVLAAKLRPLGFEVDLVPTPQAGKTHLIARLKGNGSLRPVLLAAHADTVGVERDKWSVDPFAGVERDGYIYGRGAIDFKGGIAVFGEAVMELARREVPLARDVIFLVEADEESASYNTSWLAQNYWDKIDCEFALNEGGWIITRDDGKVRYVSISTADKSSLTVLITAHGTSTHSSMPRPDNAIYGLANALAKLSRYETKVQLTPSTRQFFRTLAETSQPPMSTYYSNLVNSNDPALVAEAARKIGTDPLLHAIMRNTIAPVRLNAGFRTNVIPGSAQATINLRLIPGTDTENIIGEIKRVIDDPTIDVAPPSRNSTARPAAEQAQESSTDTALYRSLVNNATTIWHAPVTPYLFQAGTDAGAWRRRGVPVYGVYPYPITNEDLSRMHGNDERVSINSLEQGKTWIYKTLEQVAALK
jgi:acetylornithine deacetylase/succinyl-diaminopimelate desuccinylase-like protein